MADSVQVQRQSNAQLNREFALEKLEFTDDVVVLSVTGPFFFAALDTLEKAMDELNPSVRAVILRLNHVPFADGTALTALDRFVNTAHSKQIKVFLSEVNPSIHHKLTRMGLSKRLGVERICDGVPTVMAILDREVAAAPTVDSAAPLKTR